MVFKVVVRAISEGVIVFLRISYVYMPYIFNKLLSVLQGVPAKNSEG